MNTKKDPIKVLRGKKSRQAGARFELKVREDLEKQGWIVAKWTNNVEFHNDEGPHDLPFTVGKLVKVKNKFLGPGRPMMLGAGFPDFLCFRWGIDGSKGYADVIGVESKMTGVLDKAEKQKCNWMLDNNIFKYIFIAQKGEKRGEIIYKLFR